jgi:PhzF family phenazine biosynthesis protein
MDGEVESEAVASGEAPYAIIDACVSDSIEGNPAAVVQLDSDLPASTLLRLAQEMDEPVTAFVTDRDAAGGHNIRWFTRNCELRICGHATLAASEWMLTRVGGGQSVEWHSRAGVLTADRDGGRVRVSFPQTELRRMDPGLVRKLGTVLGKEPKECFVAGGDYLVVLDSGADVMGFAPQSTAIEDLDCRGVIITAEYPAQNGEEKRDYDIVSRFFAPRIAIPEDEVCVSAHCALYPYWAAKFGPRMLRALQASPRGGELELDSPRPGRVSVAGACRVTAIGTWDVARATGTMEPGADRSTPTEILI